MKQNGAEALIHFSENTVRKERIKKSYRHPALDERLRIVRNRKEAKILSKAAVRVPKILATTAYSIEMERIHGPRLRDALTQESCEIYAKQLGTMLSTLHEQDIIHGDLTTSNILVDKDELVLIDFGLSTESKRLEDKAVDLHVLKETMLGSHVKLADKFWKAFAQNYSNKHVLETLIAVEKRGRYKEKH